MKPVLTAFFVDKVTPASTALYDGCQKSGVAKFRGNVDTLRRIGPPGCSRDNLLMFSFKSTIAAAFSLRVC